MRVVAEMAIGEGEAESGSEEGKILQEVVECSSVCLP